MEMLRTKLLDLRDDSTTNEIRPGIWEALIARFREYVSDDDTTEPTE